VRLLRRNPRLVYGRMTGWGQNGPLARTAGHDISYIAITGALHRIGSAAGPPTPPLNVLGDFAGGSLYLAVGLLAAMHEARLSGEGQVVDVAIVDGVAHLMTPFLAWLDHGAWEERREANLVDGAAPFYAVYRTSDDEFMAVGAVESQFYAEFIRLLGVDLDPADQMNTRLWPETKNRIAAAFATRTRQEWTDRFDGTDACVAPVLSLSESRSSRHLSARATYVDLGGTTQPAPAPRFSRTPCSLPGPSPTPGQHTDDVQEHWLG
jgi:alpha-methylacyl-CoA racemase